jgi:hypothetical protein
VKSYWPAGTTAGDGRVAGNIVRRRGRGFSALFIRKKTRVFMIVRTAIFTDSTAFVVWIAYGSWAERGERRDPIPQCFVDLGS